VGVIGEWLFKKGSYKMKKGESSIINPTLRGRPWKLGRFQGGSKIIGTKKVKVGPKGSNASPDS